LAHHYRRSANIEKAIHYLQLAGQQAVQRSANPEAITHLTAALDLLLTRPETPERAAQELTLRLAVGPALMSALGFAAPAVEQHYARARELCAQLGDSPQLFLVLWGLVSFYNARGELRTAQALAEECLQLAEQTNEAGLLLEAHYVAGVTLLYRGEVVRAREAFEQSVALYQPQHHALTSFYGGMNPKVAGLGFMALVLWYLGYPEQALTRSHEALHMAQELGHLYTLGSTSNFAATLHVERGDGRIAQERANAAVALCSEHGFPFYWARGTLLRGAALIAQEQWEEGTVQIRQGLEAYAAEAMKTVFLAWLARGYGGAGQVGDGLETIAEALRLVDKNDERFYEAELYRIKGQLTLQQWKVESGKSPTPSPSHLASKPRRRPRHVFAKRSPSRRSSKPSRWSCAR
jgi:predicted ATPase